MNRNFLCLAPLFACVVSCNTTGPTETTSLPYFEYAGKTIYVHPTDNSPHYEGLIWGPYAMSTTEDDGQSNTLQIVAAFRDYSDERGQAYACRLCDELNAHGFSDWYLPSLAELEAMYAQSYQIGNFNSNKKYWSSTGYSHQVYSVGFDVGGVQLSYTHSIVDQKPLRRQVRCIRRDD